MMRNNLIDLYKFHWSSLCQSVYPLIEDETIISKPTCPLLINLTNEYEYQNADIRIMIFGQETNSWYEPFNSNIDNILEKYDEFFIKGECWNYGGNFWPSVNRFKIQLQNQYPTKSISLIWNNIIKIGKFDDMGRPSESIYEVEKKYFSILKEELNILKPTIALFLTGPYYDDVIQDKLGNLAYMPIGTFTERRLVKFKIPGVDFSFRTYHPGYLLRTNIDSYYSGILQNIDIEK